MPLFRHSFCFFSAGITVSHVLYGLKANFTYNLNHQNNSIGRSFLVPTTCCTAPYRATHNNHPKLYNPNRCNNFVYIQTYQAHTTLSKEQNESRRERQTNPLNNIICHIEFLCSANACCTKYIAASIGRESWSSQTIYSPISSVFFVSAFFSVFLITLCQRHSLSLPWNTKKRKKKRYFQQTRISNNNFKSTREKSNVEEKKNRHTYRVEIKSKSWTENIA